MIITAVVKSNEIKNLDKLLNELYPDSKVISSSVIRIDYNAEYKYSRSYKLEKDGLLIRYDD
jgi:hypothetical protein